MANPSLQIGNGKFAIKENDLLGYSSSGTRFFPIPITMTRATLGTRVNPSGLIEDVALLGSELVTNGGFDNGTTGWNSPIYNSTLSIVSGQMKIVSTTTLGRVAQAITTVVGKTYLINATITNIDSSTGIQLKVSNTLNLDSAYFTSTFNTTTNPVTITHYFVATATTTYIGSSQGTGAGTSALLDNVSVKEATIDGLARVDYTDGTGSLLVEPQRTNLITYSEDFSQSYWTKTGTTVESGFVSPDGTDNAFSLIEDTSTGLHLVKPPNSSFASNIYTLSVFAKYNGRILQIASTSTGGHYANFDLLNGVIGNSGGSTANVTMTEISNGWYRCSMTTTSNMNTAIINTVQSATSVYQETYTGNGTSGIYIFGAQAEAASFSTSYIKTQGSTVTRNQDLYTKTGISDKINSEEGVLFAEIAALADDLTYRGISIGDGTANNLVRFYYENVSNRLTAQIKNSGIAQATMTYTFSDITIFSKIAIKYKENDFALWVDGTEVATDTSGSTPSSLSSLQFDTGTGGDTFFGKVRQLQVFKTALSDSELATLTT